jgi:two-component system, OmpR family, phosphate regulon sensor histidine kinase PhoR
MSYRVPFRLRVLVSFLLVVILSIGVFYFWTNRRLGGFLQEMMLASLEDHLEVMAPLIDPDLPDLDAMVDRLAEGASFRVTVIDPTGRVVADSALSGEALLRLENHADRPEFAEAMRGGAPNIYRYSTTTADSLFYVARPLPNGRGVLRLAQKPEDYDEISAGLRRGLATATVILLISGGLAVWLISRRLTVSIQRVAEAATRISEGDFLSDIPVNSRDEVGDLARRMEQLSIRLEQQLALLESERNHLTTVLHSMTEGVLVTDARGRITGTNPAFRRLLDLPADPVGRMPVEIVRNAEVTQRIREVLDTGVPREAEVRNAGSIFLARFAPIGPTEKIAGVVVVFHDITELRRLETLQRDFTSNVSHELKTPLTSIQGYAETLLQEAMDAVHRGFVERIYRNAAQLSEMVEELFSLARLEREGHQLRLTEVEFGALMEEVTRDFGERFTAKNLRFRYETRCDSDRFVAARDYIRRVFRNLIENAVKYTDGGEITVSMERKDASVLFCVRDTGVGIPEEHLERIFERFYRVDRDRSRKTGGTGIGLAIVKHIVRLHSGRVWAESRQRKGTSIYFEIPASRPDPERGWKRSPG